MAAIGQTTMANSIGVTIASDQSALQVFSAEGTFTDRSGTITSGGVSQPLMASNASRKGFYIQNNSNGNLWIDYGVAAVTSQPSTLIQPNQLFEPPEGAMTTQAINIIGATTGQTFTAKEM